MGSQGFQGEARALSQSSILPKGMKLLSSISTQPAQVSNNENLPNRQTWEGIPVVYPRNLTLGGCFEVIVSCISCLFARCLPVSYTHLTLPTTPYV